MKQFIKNTKGFFKVLLQWLNTHPVLVSCNVCGERFWSMMDTENNSYYCKECDRELGCPDDESLF